MHHRYNEEAVSVKTRDANQLLILQELLNKWKISKQEYIEKTNLILKWK